MSEDARALPDFGEPLSLEEIIALTQIDDIDEVAIDAAIAWWDDFASIDFIGALDND